VRKERLELSRVSPLDPKSSASTSSATFALGRCFSRSNLDANQYLWPRVGAQNSIADASW
jgi:hypothetical protein